VIVHETVKQEFYSEFKRAAKRFYGEDILQNAEYGRCINQRNYDRVTSYLDDGEIVYGGECDDEALKIGLSLVEVSDVNKTIMKEEIFGPVLPVLTYKNIIEVKEIIDRNSDPLALYIFSKKQSFIDEILTTVHFGGGCVNDTLMHLTNEHLPFGGRGTSGVGSYHGINSYKTFTHQKSVLESSKLFELKLTYPPYSKSVLSLIKKIMY